MTQFHVVSQSNPGTYYVIDLHQETCDCMDFPRARFCKHLAAIQVHFPLLFLTKPDSILSSNATQDQDKPQSTSIRLPQESLQSLSQELARLSQSLVAGSITQLTPAPTVIEAFRLAKYSLSAAIASTEGVSALPEKDRIAPNQKSWPETAKHMGVKRAPRPKWLPEEHGLTEQCIGVAKGKKQHLYQDPYAGGERSGKHAKPDALSPVATAQVRANAACSGPAPASPLVPAFSPLVPASVRVPASSPLVPTFLRVPTSQVPPSLEHAPCSQEPYFYCWQGTT
jgi:hypothetical protein